jgi:hypothetical protein
MQILWAFRSNPWRAHQRANLQNANSRSYFAANNPPPGGAGRAYNFLRSKKLRVTSPRFCRGKIAGVTAARRRVAAAALKRTPELPHGNSGGWF